ncbi:hypothetical protein [Nocardiopsis sp. JB363]|uniref:hypothetical protein n=1 Tax=Nocardiopsis sp. JB363 TaxID=1434837 RepID=UPI00117F20C1|nr:hypothetical protein [Nocardiopsis sp. JB363]
MNDESEATLIEKATNLLLEDCMQNLGFDFSFTVDDEINQDNMAFFGPNREYRRYGNASIESAEKYGFGAPEFLQEGENGGGAEWEIGHSGPTFQDAQDSIFGSRTGIQTPSGESVPEYGCQGWSQQQIDPGAKFISKSEAQSGEVSEQAGVNSIAENIKRDSFFMALSDPQVQSVIDDWDACMLEAGYPNEDIWEIGTGDTQVQTDDREAALTDVECKNDTSLLDTFVESETRVQEHMISQNENSLMIRYDELQNGVDLAVNALSS